MRTFVHLLLFVSGIAMAVGVFGPLVGTVEARDVRFADVREGFAAGSTLDQVGDQSAALPTSLAVVLWCVAVAILLAGVIGSYGLGWLGVFGGLAALGVLSWRLNDRFGDRLSADYGDLFSGAWGLYLFGGGLVIALLALLVPRERRAL